MKQMIIFLILAVSILMSCHDVKIGFLKYEDAEYYPDSLVIRSALGGEQYDENRIANNAPWVTQNISGILGTEPLQYSLVRVKALDGTETDAKLFEDELLVRGCGAMQVPLKPKAPKGRYLVSIQVNNKDYSAILPDIFTFIIK